MSDKLCENLVFISGETMAVRTNGEKKNSRKTTLVRNGWRDKRSEKRRVEREQSGKTSGVRNQGWREPEYEMKG